MIHGVARPTNQRPLPHTRIPLFCHIPDTFFAAAAVARSSSPQAMGVRGRGRRVGLGWEWLINSGRISALPHVFCCSGIVVVGEALLPHIPRNTFQQKYIVGFFFLDSILLEISFLWETVVQVSSVHSTFVELPEKEEEEDNI